MATNPASLASSCLPVPGLTTGMVNMSLKISPDEQVPIISPTGVGIGLAFGFIVGFCSGISFPQEYAWDPSLLGLCNENAAIASNYDQI